MVYQKLVMFSIATSAPSVATRSIKKPLYRTMQRLFVCALISLMAHQCFLPPPETLFSVAQARRSASFFPTPFFSYPSSICLTWRFCLSVYDDLSPCGIMILLSANALGSRNDRPRQHQPALLWVHVLCARPPMRALAPANSGRRTPLPIRRILIERKIPARQRQQHLMRRLHMLGRDQ